MHLKSKIMLSPVFVVEACGYKNVWDMKPIFEKYPINCRDSWGSTPLHEASWWGRADMVRFLLIRGADPFAQNNYGKTPLDFAENRGHTLVSEILRESTTNNK